MRSRLKWACFSNSCQSCTSSGPRGPAATLCVYGKGCYSTQAYLIDGKIRSLTPRECARVQGYPENFVIPFSGEVAEHCFGNAIPVPVVRALMVRMLEANAKRAAVAA